MGVDFLKIKDVNRIPKHMTTIGGQALIEGVLMKGPEEISIAVRKPDKEIVVKKEKLNPLGKRYKFFSLPVVRGVVGLIEAMIFGTRALMYSAEFVEEEDKKQKDKSNNMELFFTMLLSFAIVIFFFILGPTYLTNLFKDKIQSPIVMNLIEGIIRITIFLIYVLAISKMNDVERVFQYHGAEHKTIHCYENEDDLTVENVKKYPILHPRCGTSFLFMVMIISIIVLSFFGWPNPLERFLVRLLMFPVIAGLSYEVNRIIGKSNGKLAYILSYPGLMLQKIATTKEPDEEEIEVAIRALKGVLVDNKEEDLW